MPLGVPWSKRIRIGRDRRADRKRRWIEAAGGKFENCLNLFSPHMKLFDDFLDARSSFQILKNRSHRHAGIPKHPGATTSVRHAFHGIAL